MQSESPSQPGSDRPSLSDPGWDGLSDCIHTTTANNNTQGWDEPANPGITAVSNAGLRCANPACKMLGIPASTTHHRKPLPARDFLFSTLCQPSMAKPR